MSKNNVRWLVAGICLLLFWIVLSAAEEKRQAYDTSILTSERQKAGYYSKELSKAWALYMSKSLPRAKEAFEEVLSFLNADAADRIQALFGSGLCSVYWEPFSKKEEAKKAFEEIVENYPANPVVPWALIEIGNLVYEKGERGQEAARSFYLRVLEHYPESLAIHEAALRLANAYFYELDDALMDKGAAVLEDHLRRYPDNPLASVMLFRLCYHYAQIKQDYEKSIDYAVKLGYMRMNDPFRWSRHYWHIAETYRLMLGEPVKAIPWYRKIIVETPKSIHSLSANQRLAELGYPEKRIKQAPCQPR